MLKLQSRSDAFEKQRLMDVQHLQQEMQALQIQAAHQKESERLAQDEAAGTRAKLQSSATALADARQQVEQLGKDLSLIRAESNVKEASMQAEITQASEASKAKAVQHEEQMQTQQAYIAECHQAIERINLELQSERDINHEMRAIVHSLREQEGDDDHPEEATSPFDEL
jgi:hypothetical protein